MSRNGIVYSSKTEEFCYLAVGHVLVILFLLGPFMLWANHVIWQGPLGYWRCCILGAATLILPNWFTKCSLGPLFVLTVLGQLAAWFDILALPLIK